MITPPGPLAYQLHALSWVLKQLMSPNQDIEILCKHVPRLANAAANVAKASAVLNTMPDSGHAAEIRKALKDLMEERPNNQEDSTW